MFERLLDHTAKEMAVIKGAPAAFIIAVLLVGATIFVALEWLHSERYETQEQRIEFLTEQLNLREQSNQISKGDVLTSDGSDKSNKEESEPSSSRNLTGEALEKAFRERSSR